MKTLPRHKIRTIVPAFLKRNPGRKLVAVFLAILLYYYVLDQLGGEAPFAKIPVEIELPATLHNADYTVPSVTVWVSGSKAKVNELSASDIRVRAAVTQNEFSPGMPYILRLHPSEVQVPSGIKVTKIDPSDIRLSHLEEVLSRRVPVAAAWTLPEGRDAEYNVQVQFVPESVAISGPESVVKTVKEVKISPIPLDAQPMDSFTMTAELVAPSEVELGTRQVEAHVQITQKHSRRIFKSLPLMVMDRMGVMRKVETVGNEPVDVTVAGPPTELTLMRDIQLRPYVDVSQQTLPGEYVLEVECRMPDTLECQVRQIYPSTVKVKISDP